MSDFVNNGWSIYVAAATVIGLIACLALLIIAARRKVMANMMEGPEGGGM